MTVTKEQHEWLMKFYKWYFRALDPNEKLAAGMHLAMNYSEEQQYKIAVETYNMEMNKKRRYV